MSRHTYICSTGSFLPGPPVDNEQIEDILGVVHGKRSRLKSRILRSNGIVTRHYALNDQQETTMLNEELAAAAGELCLERSEINPEDISMLSVASSQGDFILPGFGSMVQGALKLSKVELLTAHGICSSSMMETGSRVMSKRLFTSSAAFSAGRS